MTNEELKAWRKARKAARRAVVREAMACCDPTPPQDSHFGDLQTACDKLREIEAKAPKGESDE